jgi:uncharacterized protein YdaU (DUF1376 family)
MRCLARSRISSSRLFQQQADPAAEFSLGLTCQQGSAGCSLFAVRRHPALRLLKMETAPPAAQSFCLEHLLQSACSALAVVAGPACAEGVYHAHACRAVALDGLRRGPSSAWTRSDDAAAANASSSAGRRTARRAPLPGVGLARERWGVAHAVFLAWSGAAQRHIQQGLTAALREEAWRRERLDEELSAAIGRESAATAAAAATQRRASGYQQLRELLTRHPELHRSLVAFAGTPAARQNRKLASAAAAAAATGDAEWVSMREVSGRLRRRMRAGAGRDQLLDLVLDNECERVQLLRQLQARGPRHNSKSVSSMPVGRHSVPSGWAAPSAGGDSPTSSNHSSSRVRSRVRSRSLRMNGVAYLSPLSGTTVRQQQQQQLQ